MPAIPGKVPAPHLGASLLSQNVGAGSNRAYGRRFPAKAYLARHLSPRLVVGNCQVKPSVDADCQRHDRACQGAVFLLVELFSSSAGRQGLRNRPKRSSESDFDSAYSRNGDLDEAGR